LVEVLGPVATFTGHRPTTNYIITAWEQVIDYQLAIYGTCFGLGLGYTNYRHAHKHQASHELKKADKIRGRHEEDDLSEWIRAPTIDDTGVYV